MSGEASYVIDSNVLIDARRLYYGFDLCPGFWDAILAGYESGLVCSIDRVKAELEGEGDELAEWVRDTVPTGFFENTDEAGIITTYGELIQWVQDQDQFMEAAKEEFARTTNADAWLIAHAKVSGRKLVTHEAFAAEVKRKVPIPNVCRVKGVDYVNTFEMLRDLGASFR